MIRRRLGRLEEREGKEERERAVVSAAPRIKLIF